MLEIIIEYFKKVMKIVAHIPARHGSKRIPLKNLVKIKNKPLLITL